MAVHLKGEGQGFRGTTYDTVEAAPDFALTSHTGHPVSLATFRGQPVLLFFGFTHCPDVCPLTLAKLTQAFASLGDSAGSTQVLLVTLDPERDTPAALEAYVRRFGPRFHGLTGDSAALARARAGYGAYAHASPEGSTHGGMTHSSVVYGIDRQGRLQVVISEGATTEEMRHDIRLLTRM